ANLAVGLNAQAMANLSPLLNFSANMNLAFNIDLALRAALARLLQLFDSMSANGLPKAFAALPVGALPQLNPLLNLALGLNAAANLGIDAGANLGLAANFNPNLSLNL